MTNEEVSKKTNKKNHTSQKGITLIALVITIIVMLILVAVTVTIAINGGLFGMAKKAKADTEEEQAKENTLSTGRVKIDDTWYDSMEDYVNGTPSKNQILSYEDASKTGTNGTLRDNALWEEENGKTAVIPKGFKVVAGIDGNQSIDSGLVIKDANDNEFVWIPIEEDLVNPYEYSSDYSEPKTLSSSYDGQSVLDDYYGENYYSYDANAYSREYAEMVEQVNKYHGFYIGRYETTIDGNKIGSKYNTPVLSADTTLFSKDGTDYPYRWYGIYYASKNADVTGNGDVVQSAMIYGQLYDKAMDFIRKQNKAGKTSYDVDNYTSSWHHGYSVYFSGTLNPGVNGDVALNIWDLESNGWEWTQEARSARYRVSRGGNFLSTYRYEASSRASTPIPDHTDFKICSRLALYIKN